MKSILTKIFIVFQEKVGRNVRDGIIKAGPAIAVLGQAKALGK